MIRVTNLKKNTVSYFYGDELYAKAFEGDGVRVDIVDDIDPGTLEVEKVDSLGVEHYREIPALPPSILESAYSLLVKYKWIARAITFVTVCVFVWNVGWKVRTESKDISTKHGIMLQTSHAWEFFGIIRRKPFKVETDSQSVRQLEYRAERYDTKEKIDEYKEQYGDGGVYVPWISGRSQRDMVIQADDIIERAEEKLREKEQARPSNE